MNRMKRFLLALGTLAVLTQLVGCGESLPPSELSTNPAKAEEITKRRQGEVDRSGEGTAGAPGGGTAGAPGGGTAGNP